MRLSVRPPPRDTQNPRAPVITKQKRASPMGYDMHSAQRLQEDPQSLGDVGVAAWVIGQEQGDDPAVINAAAVSDTPACFPPSKLPAAVA